MKILTLLFACTFSLSALASPTALKIECKAKQKITAAGYAVIRKGEPGPFHYNPGSLALVSIAVGKEPARTFKASYLPDERADKLFNDRKTEEISLVHSRNGIRENDDYVRGAEGLVKIGECSFTTLQ